MERDQKWYRKQRTQRTYMYNPRTLTKGGGNAGGLGVRVQGGERGRNWKNCNSIISKICLKINMCFYAFDFVFPSRER